MHKLKLRGNQLLRAVLSAGVFFVSLSASGQDRVVPQLAGTWNGPALMPDDEAWQFEDYACFLGCLTETFDFAKGLFSNEENFDRSLRELFGQVLVRRAQDIMGKLTPAARQRAAAYNLVDDPVNRCEPYSLVRQTLVAAGIAIDQSSDRVTIDYELWEAERTIYLNETGSAAVAPTPLGHSVGRYVDDALVVESSGISEDLIANGIGALSSDELRVIERYSLTDDGNRLDLELTLIDPGVLAERATFNIAWRRTPGAGFSAWDCTVLLGEPE